jgi:hypothetical protein
VIGRRSLIDESAAFRMCGRDTGWKAIESLKSWVVLDMMRVRMY